MNLHPRIRDYAQDLGLVMGVNGRQHVRRDLGQDCCLTLAGADGTACPKGLSEAARVQLWLDRTRQRGIVLDFATARQALRFMASANIQPINQIEGK